ncbi:glycosyltransferase family 9 protein [Mariniblastus sp.]|nr:glycosyltransferase family 9 protein [Mariniblastus sp.]
MKLETGMENKQPTRILITRLSHIGDCILTLPVLSAIRGQYPEAFIAWAVESPTQKLLRHHPDLDEIIMIPKGWMTKPKCWSQVTKNLRSFKFDIAIDPQGITKSSLLGWVSGARTRVGGRGRWGRELSPFLNNCLVETESAHVVDRSMELLTAIGVEGEHLKSRRRELPLCEQAVNTMDAWISNADVDRPFAVINPGGSWASKRWEMDRYGAVASYLKRQCQIQSVVVWANDEELEMAKAIHEVDPQASIIAPATSLTELAALTHRSVFFVGGDTGPLHLAVASGTPCVGLYGTTRPEESGAYGSEHLAIQKWYQAGSCRERRSAKNDAMRDIHSSDVIEACDEMILKLGLKLQSVA